MLSRDSQKLPEKHGTICVVVPLYSGLTNVAKLVDHNIKLADDLTDAGRSVHLLLCSDEYNTHQQKLEEHASGKPINIHLLTTCCESTLARLKGPNQSFLLQQSEWTRHALVKLHEVHKFNVIEFADRAGLGFRTVQAKRSGLGFLDVSIVVSMHGPSAMLRRKNKQWIDNLDQLILDYCERYTFNNADFQNVIDNSIVQQVKPFGWKTRSNADKRAKYHRFPLSSNNSKKSMESRLDSHQPLVSVCVPHFNLGKYLPQALASLAAQTYRSLEVVVIDDGSTDRDSHDTFERMKLVYPQFRFVTQENMGIGATRNRGLALANGSFFLPMDADNIAHPEMIQRFVGAIERDLQLAALTCYFLAFDTESQINNEEYLYAYRPTGGPQLMSCMKNIYGDGNALFRTRILREIGGFETDRDTSFEDWEVFVKLAKFGHKVDVVPDYLFYYRHRQDGFSRETNAFQNHQRILRQFGHLEQILAGFQQRMENLEYEKHNLKCRLHSRRHRFVDWLYSIKQRLLSFFG